jgi:hypothetical protein
MVRAEETSRFLIFHLFILRKFGAWVNQMRKCLEGAEYQSFISVFGSA